MLYRYSRYQVENTLFFVQPHINYISTVFEELLARDELVYAEKCSFMEALLILRYAMLGSFQMVDKVCLVSQP